LINALGFEFEKGKKVRIDLVEPRLRKVKNWFGKILDECFVIIKN
jgi:hypothetical protein